MPHQRHHDHLLLFMLVLSSLGTACSNRCPAGTTPAGRAAPTGTAQWCAASSQPQQVQPAPVAKTLWDRDGGPGMPPSANGRALKGPMTTWTSSGELQSHGEFAMDASGVSKAEGLWTFWHPNGQVRSRGHFAMGIPVGCVSRWDEDGTHHTGQWNSEKLVYEDVPCKGPTKKGLAELESNLEDARTDTVQFDLAVSTLVVGGGFGIRNDSYEVANPDLSANIELALRRHMGSLRMGALLARRTSDDGEHSGWIAAATMALPIPSFHDKLDLEASLALGVQGTSANLALREDPEYKATSPLRFFGLYTALEVQAVLPIHNSVAFVISGRAEGGIPTEWETTKYFRRGSEQPIPHTENWQVGRYSAGLGLGVRVLLH